MMEKRTIIAIILTFLVIIGWGIIQSKFFPETVKKSEKEAVKGPPSAPEREMEIKGAEVPSKSMGKPMVVPREAARKEISVETQDYVAIFTTDGAKLKHFRLKKYLNRVEQSALTVKLIGLVHEIIGGKSEKVIEPEPLDLVNTNEVEGLPLGLTIDSNPAFSEGNWDVDKDVVRLLSTAENGELVFTKTLDNGLRLVKRFRFNSDKSEMNLDVEVENGSSREIPVRLGLNWIGKVELKKLAETDNKDFGLNYAYLKGDKVERKDLRGSSSTGCTPGCSPAKTNIEPVDLINRGPIEWLSFGGEYFCAILIPPPSKGDVTLAIKGIADKNVLSAELSPPAASVPPGQGVKFPYRIYIGPKKMTQLSELGVGADKLVDFGFFSIIAKPLLWFLNLSHSATKNFGIDIIIVSILIKIIFLPLTQMSFKSMKEMQKVQPEMARLKETYKNDKARLQQEMMLLYKRRKINPMSGCLPMLIQIPVFFALYNVLQSTFEMRHAPFFWWIRDLSAKDPIYLTPIVMGATMVIQQKMTPTSADPAQAKMFMLMPIMFTFFFLSMPSGLVLYWLVNNLLSIAHQYYLSRQS